jgi:hypothetical protein
MLEVSGDANGFVDYEFIPEEHTVSKEMYVGIPHHLKDALRRKYAEKWE